MKRKISILSSIIIFLAGCAPAQATVDPEMIYTQAAQTVQAQMNAAASLTPPTPTLTSTLTPVPTQTQTATLTPSVTPSPTWVVNPAGKATVLFLVYNDIGDSVDDDPFYQWNSDYFVGANEFKQQMRVLKEYGYNSITVSTLSKVLRDGGALPPRPVIISFDSNRLGIYRKAYPILKQLGFFGTLYTTVNYIDGENVMTSLQIKELTTAGWELGSKGMTGISMTAAFENGTLGDEISNSRIKLEEKIGVPVTSFSYPGGDSVGGEVVSRVQSWGYQNAAGLFKTSDHSLGTIYYLGRYEIRKGMALTDFLAYLPWKNEEPLSSDVINMLTPLAQSPASQLPGTTDFTLTPTP